MLTYFQKKIIYSAILAVSCCSYLSAQINNNKFEHPNNEHGLAQSNFETFGFLNYNMDDGLSNNSVTNIIQDEFGFIWIGTTDGLSMFDGKQFKVYRNKSNDLTSLADNYITALLFDSKNRLWVGTKNNGICLYNKKTDSFINFSQSKKLGYGSVDAISDDYITTISEDINGDIWVGTISGLNKFSPENNNFMRYFNGVYLSTITLNVEALLLENNIPIAISSIIKKYKGQDVVTNLLLNEIIAACGKEMFNKYEFFLRTSFKVKPQSFESGENEIRAVALDTVGGLWLGHYWVGFSYLNTETNTYIEYRDVDYPEVDLTEINSIHLDKDLLWIFTNKGKIIHFNLQTKKAIYIHENFNFKEIKQAISSSDLLLILSTNNGLIELNKRTLALKQIVPVNDKKYSISSQFILTSFIDKHENLWVGTLDKGLNLKTFNKNFNEYNTQAKPIKLSIFSDGKISSVLEDSKGNLWLGYYVGGISVVNKNRTKIIDFKSLVNNPEELGAQTVFKIFEDSDKNIWIGTYIGGLQMYDRKNKKLISYQHDNNNPKTLTRNDVRDIDEDIHGNLWISTHGGGLDKFDREKNVFVHHRTNYIEWQTEMMHDWLNSSFIDSQGNVWIASVGGLSIHNPETGTFRGFKPDMGNNKSLSHINVCQVFEDSKQNIWIGTENGLNIFNKKDSSFSSITMINGLANANIKAIMEDVNSDIWVSTNSGISRISPYINNSIKFKNINNRIINYDEQDGLPKLEFQINANAVGADGTMYFGGTNGLSYFIPENIKNNNRKPEVFIIELKLFNKSVIVNEKYQNTIILEKNIKEAKKIELNYDQNMISFNYIANNYVKPYKNKYAYMMEGFDADWQHVGNKSDASYTHLNPGKYIFKVKAANNDGIWCAKAAQLVIIVHPPFWQTWWFRIISIILVIVVLLSIYYTRIRRIQRRNRQLEKEVIQRTQEINTKNTLLQSQQEELVAQRDELAESNSVKDKLFSIVAHDLRNPFHSILGYSQLLHTQFDNFESKEKKKFIGHIYESSQRVFDLLENLLAWSLAQQGKIEYNPNIENLSELLKKNIELATAQASKKHIEIQLSSPDSDIEINFDKDLINGVVRNILSNAIKFSLEKGIIKVLLSIEEEKAIIAIKDSGVGISEENQIKLFKKTSNFTTYGTNKEKGTGLGLIMCKDFVEKHQGEIWVETNEGEGATFYFTLPTTI